MPTDLCDLTGHELGARMRSGEVTATDVLESTIGRIRTVNDRLNTFLTLTEDEGRTGAARVDEWLAGRHEQRLPDVAGIPLALKDVLTTRGIRSTAGSRILEPYVPPYDCTAWTRLRAAGSVLVGKTNCDEFAMGSSGENSAYGPTRNPWDLDTVPGGSSSGSAAAVAAHMVPLALGSQTNGSVIRPAAFCGVFAIKPTHGLISRAGVLALSRKLDHIGAFARSLEDLALILEVIAGHDPADPDSEPFAAADFRALAREPPPLPPRFAFVRTPMWDKADGETRAAFEELASALGGAIEDVDLPQSFAEAWEIHRTIMATEMTHNLAPYLARGEPSEALRKIVAHGRGVAAVDYLAALAEAPRYAASLAEIFDAYDAILTPATPGVAPKGLGSTGDPVFCTLWTLTGLPALSLPLFAGEGGLPIGAQFVGPPGRDGRLMRTARALVATLGAADKSQRKRARG